MILQVNFVEFLGLGTAYVAEALETIPNTDSIWVTESSACRGLEMTVIGEVVGADPWSSKTTNVTVGLPSMNMSIDSIYNHHPVFEIFGMDVVGVTFGHATDKPSMLVNVLFSEPITMLNYSGFDLGPGIFITSVLPMDEIKWGFHTHIRFEEGFLGETYITLRHGAVLDNEGAPNFVSSNLSLVKYQSLPFAQTVSFDVSIEHEQYVGYQH
ncbi:hypothetical protein CYMTET_13948 [Cymbomonas tetramitiformis]|uniref:Uncharacterized protein n=1 Tax=Cymbomonas tetramitiformis TaxID=36881 RepID=A0AAE0GHH9_9CHLO|nr:hypothetical protein CYMTET_13948 [Cymbomonas tetramitiformis]